MLKNCVFEATVLAALDHLPQETVLLAAVSGGADSTAMLTALASLSSNQDFAKKKFKIHVLHVNHGMRPGQESQEDALAVKNLCKNFNIPCCIASVKPGRIDRAARKYRLGPEASARHFRMAALKAEASRINAGSILTAHTRDDLLENILIRLLRGSGPAGLALMPKERGRFLRPILDLSRKQVLDYLKEKNIGFRIDSTNNETRYLRNRIRHKLIPCLDEFFPSWQSSLYRLAKTQTLAADFIGKEAHKRLAWEHDSDNNSLWVNIKDFMQESMIIQEEAVFLSANKLAEAKKTSKRTGVHIVKRHSLRQLLKKIMDGKTQTVDLGPIILKKDDKKVKVTRNVTRKDSAGFEYGFGILIEEPGYYNYKGISIKTELLAENHIDKHTENNKKNVFYAQLPFVLKNWTKKDFIFKTGQKRCLSDILNKETKKTYKAFFTALDMNGTAAFIGLGKEQTVLLCTRNINPLHNRPEDGKHSLPNYSVTVNKSFIRSNDV